MLFFPPAPPGSAVGGTFLCSHSIVICKFALYCICTSVHQLDRLKSVQKTSRAAAEEIDMSPFGKPGHVALNKKFLPKEERIWLC